MHLNSHTYYSLRYGSISPKDLVLLAKQHRLNALALTDINSTTACLDFVKYAVKNEVKPILGVDFRNGAQQKFIMLAQNNQGYFHINNYLSSFLHQTKIVMPDNADYFSDTYVIYPYQKEIRSLQKHEYIGVKPSDLNHLKFSEWRFHLEKLVLLKTVSFQDKKGFNTHRLLRAIENNTLLSKLPISEQGAASNTMVSEKILQALYSEYPQNNRKHTTYNAYLFCRF